MIERVLGSVRGAVSGERALADVRAIARFHRVQSSPGYDEAAGWLANALVGAGLEPTLERVPGDGRSRWLGQVMPEGWSCARARASLIDGRGTWPLCDADREPLSVVLRSAPARGRYPLVAAEPGDGDTRLDGRVVLTAAPSRAAFEQLVLARGAAGLLCDGRRLVPPVRTEADERDALAYTSFWWSGDEPRGWGFVVTPETGDALRRRLTGGERLELDVELDASRYAGEIPLVSARLPGEDEMSPDVLVVSHLCHPRPSANDNASGVAANLETARALAALLRDRALPPPRRGIRFLWMPELTGTCAWLGRDPARAARLLAALNLDMVGEDQEACGSTFLLERPPWFAASFAEDLLAAVRHAAQDWIDSYSGPGHVGRARMAEVPYGGGSDHVVLLDPAVGVPCPMLIQWPDRFYHSSHDTPDRCDPRSLELAARCAGTYAAFLATAGREELDWLRGRVARSARARLLRALDDGDARGIERERRRGETALESLARVGVGERAIAEERRRFRAFTVEEGAGHDAPSPGAVAGADGIWQRDPGPLDFLKHLSAGWERLAPEERGAWRTLEAEHPDALFDVAWLATDGRRPFGEVVRAAWLETGRWEPEALAAFFDWARRIGRARAGVTAVAGPA